ncbi:hypothetical protein ONS95_000511 [Cadophora gregata]|uniref:uncharacterized protein n=1 Tax=Cadophora gregata TaxID=51156 RepID=UPI0026DBD6CE|nr:uncharacterized protein ONS95_000511 [Cadophora gregata]KAK0125481.1 hypothetical protein ONS96_009319 [Cadophora gregata f. sp. sojae]KAK0128544.1 hypothetical protein ONS95_000511 [Cadophora gregata]
MSWLPHQRQSPLRRGNPNLPYYPGIGMPGQSPLTGMSSMSGIVPNPIQLQLARNSGFPSPMFPGRAPLLPNASGPFTTALQRPGAFYPPLNPNLSLSPLQAPHDPYAPYYPYTDPRHSCSSSSSCCDSGTNSNSKSDFKFKVKDVTVRGKARSVRASYLLEATKFESDLVKYMDKKKEDDVPDKVVDMLISWINRENYSNNDPFDEVTLNILASNVGCKSVLDHSLGRLKKMEKDITEEEWAKIIGTVYVSSKVDDGVKKWMCKYLKEGHRWERVAYHYTYRTMVEERPEVHTEFLRGLGILAQPDDKGLRSL